MSWLTFNSKHNLSKSPETWFSNHVWRSWMKVIYFFYYCITGHCFTPHTPLCINLSVEISVFSPICNTASIDFSFLSYVIHQKHRGVWEVWRSGWRIKSQIRYVSILTLSILCISEKIEQRSMTRVISALEFQKYQISNKIMKKFMQFNLSPWLAPWGSVDIQNVTIVRRSFKSINFWLL